MRHEAAGQAACETLELITHPSLLGKSLDALLEQQLRGPRAAYSALARPASDGRGFLAY